MFAFASRHRGVFGAGKGSELVLKGDNAILFHLAVLGKRDKYCVMAMKYPEKQAAGTEWLSFDEVLPWAKGRNALGEQVWISLNDKDVSADSIAGTRAINDIYFDIDSHRPHDRTATQDEKNEALARATKLSDYLRDKYNAFGFLADSGNGYHLHYPIERYDIQPEFRGDVNRKYAVFIDSIASGSGVEIDENTKEIRRVTTLIGTQNLKMPKTPLETFWVGDYTLPVADTARLANRGLRDAFVRVPMKSVSGGAVAKAGQQAPVGYVEAVSDAFASVWQTGIRHELLLSLIGALLRLGVDEGVIWEILQAILKKANDESYMDDARHQLEDGITVFNAGEMQRGVPYMRKLLSEKFSVAKADEIIGVLLDGFDLPKAGEMAGLVCENQRFVFSKGELYYYKDGVYLPNGELLVGRLVEDFGKYYKSEITSHYVAEVVGHIERRNLVLDETVEPFIVNLKNGLLDMRTQKFLPHTPDFISFGQLPVEYRPDARCPAVLKFLAEVVDEGDIPLLQEWIGYHLWRGYPVHKVMLLIGSGGNGKSTFLSLLGAFVGSMNITPVSIQQLNEDRFAVAELYGKLANISADLPQGRLKATGIFKMASGGDEIPAQRKNGQPFKFVNYAKISYSANVVPATPDSTTAFWRRFVIVNFPHQFIGANEEKGLIDKLTTAEELSGLLNWALEGLQRLRDNKWEFSNGISIEQTEDLYTSLSDLEQSFFAKGYVADDNVEIPKDELYADFVHFTTALKQKPVKKTTFFGNIQTYLPLAKTSRPSITIGGKEERPWCIKGLRPNKFIPVIIVNGKLVSKEEYDKYRAENPVD